MNERQTVLLVVPSIGGGGRERIAVNTATALMDFYDIKLVTFLRKGQEYECKCDVIHLNAFSKGKSKILKLLVQFKRALEIAILQRKYRAKAVISFGEAANISVALAKKFGLKNAIAAVHGFAEVSNVNKMEFVLHHADEVICISQEMREQIEKRYGFRKKLHTIENGYELAEIQNKARQEIEPLTGSPKFIAVGRLSEVKRYDRMMCAFKRFLQFYPKAELSILGDGELKECLFEMAKGMNLDKQIHFLGNIQNPYPYIANADVLLLTSRNEGFPNVLVESLACGTPIVAVDCQSGPREILSKNYESARVRGVRIAEYGVLVGESVNEEELLENYVSALITMIEDKTVREGIKSRAIGRAADFSLEVYAQKIRNLIESCSSSCCQ